MYSVCPRKKLKLHMWSSAVKKATLKDGDNILELKEERTLFARILVVFNARGTDLNQTVGTHELSVVP